MARLVRNLLVLFGPPILVSWPVLKHYLVHATADSSGRDALIVSVLAHIVAAMLSLASLAMSFRLIWATSGSLLLARTLLWLDVAAAWGVLCATATSAIASQLSFADATWGFSIIMSVVDLATAALLVFMIRRAERGNARRKPWTMFA
jgi:hypothetical protein